MRPSSTICIGDSLFTVLRDLRARGARVLSLDTAVGGKNSQYRVSFYERVGECKTQGVRGDKMSAILTPGPHSKKTLHAGSNPAALTNFPVPALAEPCKTAAHDGGPKCSEAQVSALAGDPSIHPLAAGNSPSLETRLQQLYEKAVKSGRVRTRFKTSTAAEHARVPYRDE